MKRPGRLLWIALAAAAASVPVLAAGLPDQAEVALWDRARQGDRVALRQYLDRYPDGYWAESARKLAAEAGSNRAGGVFLTPLPPPNSAVPPPPAVSATPMPPPVSALPMPPQSGSTGPATAPLPEGETGLRTGDATALYNRAFGYLRQGQWGEAETALSELLRRYPRDELAPNARYWLAETYFQRGDNARAAQAFAEVYHRNPDAPRAPDALFKEGLAREQAGDHYGACTTWMRLKSSYPGATDRYGLDERC